MAYDPDAHERLYALSEKYSNWLLSHVRAVHDIEQPVINADGVEATLYDCYDDALVATQALFTYLVENLVTDDSIPRRDGVTFSEKAF